MAQHELSSLIQQKRAKVGIIGLGYVGLPLAAEFAAAGFLVTGFEIDRSKVNSINQGISYIPDVSSDLLRRLEKKKTLQATGQFDLLKKMNAVIVCVPTPLRKTKDPDISYIVSALNKICDNFTKGQLIVLESTTYPGTTREILLPRLQETGVKVGKDFYLAFSPERVDPGNKSYGVRNTPKIVGGITPACTDLAAALYGSIVEKIVKVSSPESAEMVKLLENTFRAVNIGLVNEVALMCDRLNLDTWEVIEAAATKPFGFMPFFPGPGLGGHCIPLDPHYLSWKLKTLNFNSRFIELASEVNGSMPAYVVTKVADALNDRGKSIKGAKILVVGVAYKKDVGDVRESPALDIIESLRKKKGRVSYHDPYVPKLTVDGWSSRSVPLSPALLKNQDCVLIATNHSQLDMNSIVTHSRLIFDTRNGSRGFRQPHIVKL